MIRYPKNLIKWNLCYTDDNTPYYFNEITREISWDKPDNYIESTSNHSAEREDLALNTDNNVSLFIKISELS